METELDKVTEDIMSDPKVLGCMLADHQGLCLSAQGIANADSSGLVVAISEQACKLQPDLRAPTITLESDKMTCMIQRYGTITGAVYTQKNDVK